jgi:hypothetical protein
VPRHFTVVTSNVAIGNLLEVVRSLDAVVSASLQGGEAPSLVAVGHDGKTIALNFLRHREAGDQFSNVKLGMFDFFYRVKTPHEAVRTKILKHLENIDTAIGVVLEPPSSDEHDWRFDTIFAVAEATQGLIFNGSDLIDCNGKLALTATGRSEWC